jgi:hypothetical protein
MEFNGSAVTLSQRMRIGELFSNKKRLRYGTISLAYGRTNAAHEH